MKKRLIIPIIAIFSLAIVVVYATWNIINQKNSQLPSEYFPFEVDFIQETIFNGKNQDIDINFDDEDVNLENSNLTVKYYPVTEEKVNGETKYILGNLLNESPRNHGTYLARIYADKIDEENQKVTEEISSVKFVIKRRCIKVLPASYAAYFGQNLAYKQFVNESVAGYTLFNGSDDIQYYYEDTTEETGLVSGHTITNTSSFAIKYYTTGTNNEYALYNNIGIYEVQFVNGSFDIKDENGFSELNNYEIEYSQKGKLAINSLPLNFSWVQDSLTTTYSGQYQRPNVTFSTSIEGVNADDLANALSSNNVDVITNKDDNSGKSTMINAMTYSDVKVLNINNSNYELIDDLELNKTSFVIKPYEVEIKWGENNFTYDGQYKHPTATITTPLLTNVAHANVVDTCNVLYDDDGMINANIKVEINNSGSADLVIKDGIAYTCTISGLDNSNYTIKNYDSDVTVKQAYYYIYPKKVEFTWDSNNVFTYAKTPYYVSGTYDETALVTQVNSTEVDQLGLTFIESEVVNANYIDEANKIESAEDYYTNVTITNGNYYLTTYKKKYKILQKPISITWNNENEFTYAGKYTSAARDTIKYQYATASIDADQICAGDIVNISYDENSYNYLANYIYNTNTKVKDGNVERGDYTSTAVLAGEAALNYKISSTKTCSYKIYTSVQDVQFIDYTGNSNFTVNTISTFGLRSEVIQQLSRVYNGKSFTPQAKFIDSLESQGIYEDLEVTVSVGVYELDSTDNIEKVRNAGSYNAQTLGISNVNYTMNNTASLSVIIEQKPFEIEWSNLILEYAGKDQEQIPTAQIKASDIQTNDNGESDDISISVDAAFKQIDANATPTGTLLGETKYDVALTTDGTDYIISGLDARNYCFESKDQAVNTFIIKQVNLTIKSKEKEITYGDAPELDLSYVDIQGLVQRDQELVTPTDYSSILSDLNYETTYEQYKDITDDNNKYTSTWSATNNNYAIKLESAPLIVKAKPITFEWDTIVSRIYNGEKWAPDAKLVGVLDIDTNKIKLSRDDYKIDSNAKANNTNYTASISGLASTDDDNQHKNYILTGLDNTISFYITQRPVTIDWTNTTTTYSAKSFFPEYTFKNVVGNEDLDPVKSGAETDANQRINGSLITGKDVYTATITSLGNLNYKLAEEADINDESGITKACVKSINFYIKALAVTISWKYPDASYSYLGIEQKPTASIESDIFESDKDNVIVSSTVSSKSTIEGFLAGIWAGEHTATAALSGSRALNYEINENIVEDYTIGKAPLTITANGKTIVYGDAPTNNGYTSSGFVHDETVSILNGTLDYTFDYKQYDDKGTNYKITPSGYSHNNYDITFNEGILVVNARPVEITWTVAEKYTYNGTEQSPTATVSNRVNGDEIVVTVSKFINANVGTAKHTSEVVSIDNDNYTLNDQTFSQEFTIQPKPITIIWGGYDNLTYNGKVQELSVTSKAGDILNGDSINYSYEYTTGEGRNAGEHVAIAVISGNTNYVIGGENDNNPTLTYNIAKLTITVDWQDELTFKFDNSIKTPEVEITNLQTNEENVIDICTFTLVITDENGTVLTGGASAVGTYTAMITGLSNENYQLPETLRSIDFTIRMFSIVIIIEGTTITYGVAISEITFNYALSEDSDVEENLEITGKLTFNTTYYQFANANAYYSISNIGGLTVDGYEIEYEVEGGSDKAIRVNPATITSINWVTTGLTYNGSNQLPSASFNLLAGDTSTNNKVNVGIGNDLTEYKNANVDYTAVALSSNNSNYVLSEELKTETRTYKINQKNIGDSDVEISTNGEFFYTGYKVTPTELNGTLRNISGNVSIVINRDFIINSYDENINAGIGGIIINGTGNYTGTKNVQFTINKGLVTFELNMSKPYLLIGEKISVNTLLNGIPASGVIDNLPIITYNDSTSAPSVGGTYNYVVLIEETENYNVNTLVNDIDVCELININDVTIEIYYNGTVYKNDAIYQGSDIPLSVIVSYNNTELDSSLYTETYSSKINAGTQSVSIKGTGKYTKGIYYILSTESDKSSSYIINQLHIKLNSDCIEKDYTDSFDWSSVKDFLSEKIKFLKSSDNTEFNVSNIIIKGMHNGYYYYGYESEQSAVSEFKKPESQNLVGSTYMVTISVNNNYVLDGINYLIFKYKTAYFSGNEDEYYTIEDAIYNSTTSSTIILKGVASNTHFITTSFSKLSTDLSKYTDDHYILDGKLRVPFADVDMDYHGSGGETGSSSNQYDSIEVAVNNTVYSTLVIPTEITLNLNSNSHLVVGGLLTQQSKVNNRGIIMNNGAIIAQNNSNISSYGYIKGTGIIEANSAKLTDVFNIVEWRGGAKVGGLNNAKVFPINGYTVHNISCTVKILAGTTYEAFWTLKFANRLYTGYQRGDKNGNIIIVGDNGLFNLIDGYILKTANEGIKYSSKTELLTITGSNQSQGQKDSVEIYGKCFDNSVSITIAASILSIPVSTSTDFPISISYMDVIVGNDKNGNIGNLTFQISSYKFYPGSSLIVEEGASLTIKKNVNLTMFTVENAIIDQSTIQSPFITTTGGYCVDRNDAVLIVDGTLIVESGGYIGGKIKTRYSSGKISFKEYNYTNVKYVTSYSEGYITDEYGTTSYTHNAYINLYDDASNTVIAELTQPNTNTTYYAKNGGWIIDTTKYQINYSHVYSNCESSGLIENSNPTDYEIKDNFNLTNPKNGDLTFVGWYLDELCTKPISIFNGSDFRGNVTLYAKWEFIEGQKHTITFDSNGGTPVNPIERPEGTPIDEPEQPTKTGYDFIGWYTEDDVQFVFSTMPDEDITLIAKWQIKSFLVTFISNNTQFTSQTVNYGEKATKPSSNPPTLDDSNEFKYWKNEDGTEFDFNTPITDNITLTAHFEAKSSGGGCFAAGTLINMYDGTYKKVEDLIIGDKVLVFNHNTGKIEVSVITINVHDNVDYNYYETLVLTFSNGTTISIINDHGFYDFTLNKYVAISLTNYHEFIGHEFYSINENNELEKVKLISGYIEERYSKIYSPFTYEHLNMFAEGLLTLSGEVVALYNTFEFDDNALYDKDLMKLDIEKYGLYTYEDFKDYATEEEFNAFNAKYFKVAVGKGYISYDDVLRYINTYLRGN